MKKLISYGFILILNFVRVCQPALIVVASEASKPTSHPPGNKIAVTPKTKRPARIQQRDLAGQTSTSLADGRFLIIGGEDTDGAQTRIAIHDPRSGEATLLSVSLREARAWHTATMLPDGRVLLIGGKG